MNFIKFIDKIITLCHGGAKFPLLISNLKIQSLNQ